MAIKTGRGSFKNFLEYYNYVMEKYFRKAPPVASNIYISGELLEDEHQRAKVARICHFPSIINILANDESDLVRSAARKNEFWNLVGQYQDIMGFDKRERKEFAMNEGQTNVLVLLMYEDDLDIINELLRNPVVSVQMMVKYMHLLKARGNGKKDEQIADMCIEALKDKKERIVRISEINKVAENLNNEKNLILFLNHFSDEDKSVRKALYNILIDTSPLQLKRIVFTSLESKHFDSSLLHFEILAELVFVIQKREDLKRANISDLNISDNVVADGKFLTIADFFLQMLIRKQAIHVKACSDDLTNFDNVILLSHSHLSTSPGLRSLAAKQLSLEDIFNLVNDVSTPRKVFNRVLDILSYHFDESVTKQVSNSFENESHRLRENLKELEMSVQAYFDIVFQSFGYNQINEYHDAIKSIAAAEKQIQKFSHVLKKNFGEKQNEMNHFFLESRMLLNNTAHQIYYDTSPKIIHELEYVRSLIDEIFELKERGLMTLRPGTPEDIESEIMTRARTIWRSAISAYLGRIKDLSEMVKKKIMKLAMENESSQEFTKELDKAVADLEFSYKQKVDCHLTILCQSCNRRGCSAERFLSETSFFIGEILDNFVNE